MEFKLPSNIKIPFMKPRDAFAIDLGSTAIKFLYLKASGSKHTIVKWAFLPIGDEGVDLSPIDRKNIALQKLGEFLAKEKILLRNVVSSISGNQIIVRYVKFPKLSREELAKTIQFEAEPYIPFDIKEVDLGFHILGDVVEDGQKKMETILVAAKKEIIQNRLALLDELGLRPVVIDVDSFALQNAYEYASDSSVQETVMLINLGASVTNMAIVENFTPRVVRDVFISGNSITKAIQRTVACDLKTAEDLKTRYSILVTAEEKEKTLAENQKEAIQVSSAISTSLRDLVLEIQRSIDFYVSQNPEKGISRILISGGSSNMKNIDAYFAKELKIPTERFNPLNSMEGGDSIPENIVSKFAIVAGLALRRENDTLK